MHYEQMIMAYKLTFAYPLPFLKSSDNLPNGIGFFLTLRKNVNLAISNGLS
jgi:hypothetical protein